MNTNFILGLLTFAVVTAILYAWGYVKSQRKATKIQQKFKRKAMDRVWKIISNKEKVEFEQIKEGLKGLEVKSGLLSSMKITVQEPEELATTILKELEAKEIIKIESWNDIIKYKIKKTAG